MTGLRRYTAPIRKKYTAPMGARHLRGMVPRLTPAAQPPVQRPAPMGRPAAEAQDTADLIPRPKVTGSEDDPVPLTSGKIEVVGGTRYRQRITVPKRYLEDS